MELVNFIAELVSMLFSIGGFLAFVLIINIVLKAHKNDPDYDRKVTVRFFQYLFFIMAILDTLLILDKFFHMGRHIITIIFVIRAIVTIVTVINYYMDIPKFKDRKISLVKHNETINNVISDFHNLKLSPEVEKEMVKKLENYKHSE